MFQNKLHSSTDQNTFWIHSPFKASKGRKIEFILIQARGGLISKGGGGGGGLITASIFCLPVDGPIACMGAYNWGGGLISGRLRYWKNIGVSFKRNFEKGSQTLLLFFFNWVDKVTGFFLGYLMGKSFPPNCPASLPKILLSLQYISNYIGKIIQTRWCQCTWGE